MKTITRIQETSIRKLLKDMTLPAGLGTPESACSIATINLALTGTLTDKIPDCMSKIIGKWIISAQDRMPAEMRNSKEWKRLLPLAAGTGRDPEKEKERMALIREWYWGSCLTQLQEGAEKRGYGELWKKMTTERTKEAALEAKKAAAAAAAYAADDADAAYAAASYAAYAAAAASYAAYAAAAYAAYADAAAYAADDAARKTFWTNASPVELLKKLVAI